MRLCTVLEGKATPLHTVGPDTTLAEASKEMKRRHVGALLVTDPGGKLRGIVSERDIIGAMAEYGRLAFRYEVADVMTRDVATCEADADLEDAVGLMETRHIRHVPVTDHGYLVGVISVRDVMQARMTDQTVELASLQTMARCRPHAATVPLH